VNIVAVDGQTVKAEADDIAQKVGIGFKCSNRWLQQFRERWNITC
jgi:transposase